MSSYTTTIDGFQKAMEMSLDDAVPTRTYVEATSTSTFYQLANGARLKYEDYIKTIDAWKPKLKIYKPKVEHFLRDGDLLSAHMTGTVDVEGLPCKFETFIFNEVEKASGKLMWIIDRSI